MEVVSLDRRIFAGKATMGSCGPVALPKRAVMSTSAGLRSINGTLGTYAHPSVEHSMVGFREWLIKPNHGFTSFYSSNSSRHTTIAD